MSTPGKKIGDGTSDVEPQGGNDTGTRMLTDEEIDAAASKDPAEPGTLDAEPGPDVAPDSADQDATHGQDATEEPDGSRSI